MKLKEAVASFISGSIISLLNTLIEHLSNKYQLYTIKGEPKIFSTPIYFFLLWMALATAYALTSFRLKKRTYLYLYILIGILAGWLFDLSAWKIGILSIGDRGNPLINAFIWIFLVPLTILIAHSIRKLLNKG